MWANINLTEGLTLGELRELVNNGKLSEFPDDTLIYICTDIDVNNSDKVVSILGDEECINFYSY